MAKIYGPIALQSWSGYPGSLEQTMKYFYALFPKTKFLGDAVLLSMEKVVVQPWALDWLFNFHRGLLTSPIWGLHKLMTGLWRGRGLWGLGNLLTGKKSTADVAAKDRDGAENHYAIVNSDMNEAE